MSNTRTFPPGALGDRMRALHAVTPEKIQEMALHESFGIRNFDGLPAEQQNALVNHIMHQRDAHMQACEALERTGSTRTRVGQIYQSVMHPYRSADGDSFRRIFGTNNFDSAESYLANINFGINESVKLPYRQGWFSRAREAGPLSYLRRAAEQNVKSAQKRTATHAEKGIDGLLRGRTPNGLAVDTFSEWFKEHFNALKGDLARKKGETDAAFLERLQQKPGRVQEFYAVAGDVSGNMPQLQQGLAEEFLGYLKLKENHQHQALNDKAFLEQEFGNFMQYRANAGNHETLRAFVNAPEPTLEVAANATSKGEQSTALLAESGSEAFAQAQSKAQESLGIVGLPLPQQELHVHRSPMRQQRPLGEMMHYAAEPLQDASSAISAEVGEKGAEAVVKGKQNAGGIEKSVSKPGWFRRNFRTRPGAGEESRAQYYQRSIGEWFSGLFERSAPDISPAAQKAIEEAAEKMGDISSTALKKASPAVLSEKMVKAGGAGLGIAGLIGVARAMSAPAAGAATTALPSAMVDVRELSPNATYLSQRA